MGANRILTVLAILVLVGVFGFIVYSSNKTRTTPSTQTPSPMINESVVTPSVETVKEITIMLAEENKSSQSGIATLMEENGKVKVTLEMSGAPKGVSQPAHIHVGKCPEVGDVKYPLTSVLDGKSETILDTTFDQLKQQLPLGLNVHKSATQAKIYVSCGDITGI